MSWRVVVLLLLATSCFVAVGAGEAAGDELASGKEGAVKGGGGPVILMKRRLVRKRVLPNSSSSDGNVSVSISITEGGGSSDGERAPLFTRASNKARVFTTSPVGIPTPTAQSLDAKETPNTSFKLRMRPRLPFGKIRTTANSILEEEEEDVDVELLKTSAAATASTPRPPLFTRKRVFYKPRTTVATTTTTSSSSTTTADGALDDDDEEEELTLEEDNKEEGDARDKEVEEVEAPSTTTTPPKVSTTNSSSSMIIIPVPPSQRKPYHPVIMQVTKSPPTSPSKLQETKVTTYKLNKMFIPMGIYGKVMSKNKTGSGIEKELLSRETLLSTPLPFLLSGRDSKKANKISGSPTPSPEIKVKGHRSKEVDLVSSSSDNYETSLSYLQSQKHHHQQKLKQYDTIMERLRRKHRKNIVDSISLTYDGKNYADVSLTTERVRPELVSLTTESSLYGKKRPSSSSSSWLQSQPSQMHDVSIPTLIQSGPPQKSIFQTITSAASSIPSLIHDGLTSLTSYPNPFEDDTFMAGSHSVPVGSQMTVGGQHLKQQQGAPPSSNNGETLEFFRKRPYLLKQQRNRGRFTQPDFSSGFKPASAPDHIAQSYYASTTTEGPLNYGSSTAPPRIEAYFAEHENEVTPRSPKKLVSHGDDNSWHGVVQQQENSGGSSPRPLYVPSTGQPPPISFITQWHSFNSKYSKAEIEGARDRIYSLFQEPKSSSSQSSNIMFMKPPGESKRSSGSAFEDLMKMFRMGFSMGAGQGGAGQGGQSPHPSLSSTSSREQLQPSSYNQVYDYSRLHPSTTPAPASALIDDGWRPLGYKSPGQQQPTPGSYTKSQYSPNHYGSHFSSSTKPLHSHASTLLNAATRDYFSSGRGPTKSSASSHYDGSKRELFNLKPEYDYSYAGPPHLNNVRSTTTPPLNYYNYASSTTPPPMVTQQHHFTLQQQQRVNDPAIEIIPSSLFFKQNGNIRDIAAIIKPPELSSELVKSVLPPQMSYLPQLSVANTRDLVQNPGSYKSLSQLQSYFATGGPQQQHLLMPTTPSAIMHPQYIYMHGGQLLQQLPQQQQLIYRHPQQLIHHGNHVKPAASQQQQQQQKDGLGFTEYKLPAGLDPDIATLIRAELEKDDVPEEYRRDFAKEEKAAKDGAPSSSNIRVSLIKPSSTSNKSQLSSSKTSSRRSDHSNYPPNNTNISSKPTIKFHAPVPITPTMLTPTTGAPSLLGGGKRQIRPASPVPKYVVELARKLKNEKDLQGIVRVSTKRGGSPPIEYLYPVRG